MTTCALHACDFHKDVQHLPAQRSGPGDSCTEMQNAECWDRADYYTHMSHNHQIWWGSAVLLSSKDNRGVHSDPAPSKTVTLTGDPLVYTR